MRGAGKGVGLRTAALALPLWCGNLDPPTPRPAGPGAGQLAGRRRGLHGGLVLGVPSGIRRGGRAVQGESQVGPRPSTLTEEGQAFRVKPPKGERCGTGA